MPPAWCGLSSICFVCLQLRAGRAEGVLGGGGLPLSLAARDGPAPVELIPSGPSPARADPADAYSGAGGPFLSGRLTEGLGTS